MTAPIEDVSSLPGKKVSDQSENPIGEVKQIYATEGYPMWVAVEMSSGLAKKRTVFIPLARIKDENGELRVPYSAQRLGDAPEIDDSDGISAECDRELRDYYGIDTGDQELRQDNKSYATLVPEEAGESQLVENVDELETPDADTRTDESRERLHDPGSSEIRHVTAEDVTHDNQDSSDEDSDDDEESRSRDESDSQSEPKSEAKAESQGESESKSESKSEPKGDSESESEGDSDSDSDEDE